MKTRIILCVIMISAFLLVNAKADQVGNEIGTYEMFDLAARTSLVGTYGSKALDRTGFNSCVAIVQSAKSSAGESCSLEVIVQHSSAPVDGLISTRRPNDATDMALNDHANRKMIAAEFTQKADQQLKSITVKLKKVGTLTDKYVIATLKADSSGLPDGDAVHADLIDSVATASIDTVYKWFTFNFDRPQDMDSGEVYHMELSTDYTADGANYVVVQVDDVDSNGNVEVLKATTWQDSAAYNLVGYTQVYNFKDISGTLMGKATTTAPMFSTKDINLRSKGRYLRLKMTCAGTSGSFVSGGLIVLGESRKKPVTD